MAKRDKYNPDYKELYPGEKISPEVLKVLQQSDRKMKYMEVEIKHGVFRQDIASKTAAFSPTREDSLERLLCDEGMEFASDAPSPEEIAIHKDTVERLRKALEKLSSDERMLVKTLFEDGMSERQYAKQLGISQKAVNKRWHKTREKLRKLMIF